MPRSLWSEPRTPGAPALSWRDWSLAAVFCALSLVEYAVRPSLPGGVVGVLLVFLLAPTLLFRRSHPLLMVAIAFAATAIAPVFNDGVPPEAASLVYLALLPYSLLRWGSGREIVLGLAVIVVKIVVSMVARQMTVPDALAGAAVTFAVAALGVAMRYRAAGRVRELDRVRAVERERLARDLHDTVAHHVSAMAIRAQAGLAAGDLPSTTEALRLIEAEATKALAEMRTVVRALRSSDPTPLLADLGSLTDGRPPVDLVVSGDLDAVAPAVGAAIFRLAQEAVTNARRHARHATRIAVRVAVEGDVVHLRVTDDGAPADGSGVAGGFGLAGMRERAALLDGVCTAGPDPGGGWAVSATLPRSGEGHPSLGLGEAAPLLRSGEAAPSLGLGEAAPLLRSGEAAPSLGLGEAAPLLRSGEAAPSLGSGQAAPSPRSGGAARSPRSGSAATSPHADPAT